MAKDYLAEIVERKRREIAARRRYLAPLDEVLNPIPFDADRGERAFTKLKRNGAALPDDTGAALTDALSGLDGYSNADLEAVALLALDIARNDGAAFGVAHVRQAIDDFIPPQHADTIQMMELLAVQESSRRSLLPERFAKLTPSEVSELIGELKRRVR